MKSGKWFEVRERNLISNGLTEELVLISQGEHSGFGVGDKIMLSLDNSGEHICEKLEHCHARIIKGEHWWSLFAENSEVLIGVEFCPYCGRMLP